MEPTPTPGPLEEVFALFAAVIASALLGIALFGAVTWMGSTLLARWGSTGE